MGYCPGSHSLLEFFSEGICDTWLDYSARQELQSGLSDDKQIPGKTQKRSEYSGTKRSSVTRTLLFCQCFYKTTATLSS